MPEPGRPRDIVFVSEHFVSVYAFRPRSVDPPHFVTEFDGSLIEKIGETLSAEQCDQCGNSCYRVRADGRFFYAECVTDPDRGQEDGEFTGCGFKYPIRLYHESEVVF